MTETLPIDAQVRRSTLPDMLRRHAARSGNALAVAMRSADGGRRALTYRELDAVVNRVADDWHRHGLRRGDVVAVLDRNSVDVLVAFFAAARCGAVFTGLNPLHTTDELRFQLEHAAPVRLVVGPAHLTRIDELRQAGVPLPPVSFTTDELFRAAPGDTAGLAHEPDVVVDESDTALLVYTSGTESRPKGVMLTHRGFLLGTMPSWLIDGYLRSWDRFLLLAPMYTMAGIGTSINTIAIGATLVLVESTEPAFVLGVIDDEGVTNMSQTPTFYRRLVTSPEFETSDLRTIQQCHTYGGLTQAAVFEKMSSRLPDMVWATYWGQSELTQLGSIGWFRTVADIPRGDLRWIGRPVPHLDVRVVDDDGRDAEVGELIVRSPAVMAGYRSDPASTMDAVRDGWLRTGDIVGIDDDRNLYFFDRRKDVIKTGGMNVSSLEVEQVLGGHPVVAEVAVIGVPHEEWSEAVTAFVVPHRWDVDPDELRAFCRTVLAPYKVPKQVHFVTDLPRDGQGKIRKRELRATMPGMGGVS